MNSVLRLARQEVRSVVKRGALLAVAAALLGPAAASAHEVLHEIERSRAIAVKAYFSDGEVLAHAQVEIYSPRDPGVPAEKARTDRNGWVSFVPDAPGRWRVKVIDAAGHGTDLEVDADATPAAASARRAAPPTSASAAFVLRPLVGLAVIAAVFGALFLFFRRKGTQP